MFNLFPQQDETRFTWDWVGDVDRGRQNLGEQMPVFVYRLFQFTIKDELTKRCGSQAAAEILRKAGELAGKEFAAHLLDLSLPFNQFVAHWQTVLEECRIGILRWSTSTRPPAMPPSPCGRTWTAPACPSPARPCAATARAFWQGC